MLERIRETAPRWLVSAILVLLVVPFALWGIGSYVKPSGQHTAARVGDSVISVATLQEATRQEGQRLRRSLGKAYTPELLDNPNTRQAVLERLVNRELLLNAARQRRLQVPDAELAAVIQAAPAFASSGGFDRALYESQLRRQGLTPTAFEAQLRHSLALQQLENGLAETAFVSDAELDALAALWFERRDLRVATLDWRKFAADAAPDAAAVQAYYDAHKGEFMTAEQVRVAYVELSLDEMAARVSVSDAQIAKRYEEIKSELGKPEQRQVRHILIAVAKDATPQTVEQARQKALDVRAKIAAGADFAAVAKTESADSGSADRGGDLGTLERGTMTPAFDKAAFSLPLHTLSEPIRTPFGFHLIEVTGIRPAQAPPLEQVRDTVRRRVQRDLAQDKFFAAAETLREQAFEHPDTLEPAAQALDLKIQEVGPLTRAGGKDVAANPEFLRHAFSTEVIGGDNSEVFELGDGRYAVLRVTDHTPAVQRPFKDVRGDIEARLRQQAAASATRKVADALAQKARSGEPIDAALAQHGAAWKDLSDVGREGAGGIPDAVLKQAFSLAVTDGKPGYAAVGLEDGNYVIVAATARRPGTAAHDSETREALRRQLLAIRADQALSDELMALRTRYPVRITEAALAPDTAR